MVPRVKLILCCLIYLLSIQINKALCHEVRPAYLQITQLDSVNYTIIWKMPVTAGRVMSIRPILPQGFEMNLTKEKSNQSSLSQMYTGVYNGSLIGKTIKIDQLEKTLIDVFTQIELSDGMSYSFLIQADKPFCTIPETPDLFDIATSYTRLGIDHILGGYDHLLFVLTLLLLITSMSTLLWTITCFTLAHSITLALASLDVLTLASPPVEAVIALSIVFLAREYIELQSGGSSITNDYPWAISFGFGLLHGFGFAGALQDIGFPQQQLFSALLSFNLGVEVGQIIFIIFCLCLYFLWTKLVSPSFALKTKKIAPYAIGSIASFWLIQRMLIIL